jgi:cytochrome c-type biogenesis protein CcmE
VVWIVRLVVTLALLIPASLFGLIRPGVSIVVIFAAALVAFGVGRAAVMLPRRFHPWLLGVSMVVIAGSLAFRLLSDPNLPGIRTVAEAKAAGNARRIQVRGYVLPGSIWRRDGVVAFKLKDGEQFIWVRHRGVPPDSFRDGMEVVARGHLQSGTLEAGELLVKCPDNYDRSKGPAPF